MDKNLKKLKTLEKNIKNWLYNHKWYIDNYERLVDTRKYTVYLDLWQSAYEEAKKTNPDLSYDFGDMIS
jgi:hypothetical protein